MNATEEIIECNVFHEEIQTNSKVLIDFLVSKRNLHWEVYKNIENKAIQLLLSNGVILGLLINIVINFPELEGRVHSNFLNLDYHFLGITIILYAISMFCSIYVISKTLFLDTFTDKGFIKQNVEATINRFILEPSAYCLNNNLLFEIINELHAELELLKKKNTSNSIIINVGIVFFSLGVLIIILSILSII
ncbi:hypothetical protein [uncultured Methanolobus sp.]|uniref:hypothetical protein n=1 Tax=uncultured Methanolobus sp. TaxID=218300 RepID=UPI002AAB70EF|nr:hypothetical protein [uncultured Methanolobus sp.]